MVHSTLKLSVIVCAYNEEHYVAACLHSLLAQSRRPDEVILVNNASTDRTGAIARAIPGILVIDEVQKGLVKADCRAPLQWLERVERRFLRAPRIVAVTGPYRFYDWDVWGRLLLRGHDLVLAPATQVLVQYVLRIGAILYGGNFAVRREALAQIGGFDTSIEFHGEDTNLARRLSAIGRVQIAAACFMYTSARRYRAMGKGAVFGLYIRNFWSELLRHRPSDRSHLDVRT
jgi:glycosyltransferase involved in cell wall biosynthesis